MDDSIFLVDVVFSFLESVPNKCTSILLCLFMKSGLHRFLLLELSKEIRISGSDFFLSKVLVG